MLHLSYIGLKSKLFWEFKLHSLCSILKIKNTPIMAKLIPIFPIHSNEHFKWLHEIMKICSCLLQKWIFEENGKHTNFMTNVKNKCNNQTESIVLIIKWQSEWYLCAFRKCFNDAKILRYGVGVCGYTWGSTSATTIHITCTE